MSANTENIFNLSRAKQCRKSRSQKGSDIFSTVPFIFKSSGTNLKKAIAVGSIRSRRYKPDQMYRYLTSRTFEPYPTTGTIEYFKCLHQQRIFTNAMKAFCYELW